MTSSVISAIQSIQSANNKNQEKTLGKIDELSSSLTEKLSWLSEELAHHAADFNLKLKEIKDLISINNSETGNVSEKISHLNDNITVVNKELSQKIVEKSELLSGALENNSNNISSLTSTLNSVSSKLSSEIEQFKDTSNRTSNAMAEAIRKSMDELAQKVTDIIEQLEQLKTNIESYNISALGIKDSNNQVAIKIADTITAVDRTCSNITLQNKRLLDELNDSIRTNIDDLLNGVKDATDTQAESLSNTENSLKKSIDSLCIGLSTNIKKLGIDIEDICNSISEMKQTSDFVEQADKDLLAKISKICK
jgi:ABC-type transporter Mla subunit MlaD